jgi:hypothetical protein
MKKITTVALFILLLFQTKAQNVSVNYVHQFVSESKSYVTNNKFTPYAVSEFSVAFSQQLKKLPLNINVVAARVRRKPPPHYIPYPDPPVIGRYAIDNNIEADSAGVANSKSSSINLLVGAGFIIPHKENSKFLVTLNADFGVAFNNEQAFNYYYRGKKTGAMPNQKTQLIINPNIQAKYFFSKSIGLNLIAGYNNTGGVNAGGGVVVNLNRKHCGSKASDGCANCKACGRAHGKIIIPKGQ